MFNVDKLKNSVINGYKLKKEDALSPAEVLREQV